MKVFMSWSGERSRLLAGAMRTWIPSVIQVVEPWMSDADIEPGQQWLNELAEKLSEHDFGILYLTPENLDSPWLLFEAGALSKSVGKSHVVPLLMGIEASDVALPLGAFQAKKADKARIRSLIELINGTIQKPLPSANLAMLFDAMWPSLQAQISAIPSANSKIKPPQRPEGDLLAELVTSMRRLEARLETMFLSGSRTPGGHPILEMLANQGAPPLRSRDELVGITPP